MFRKKPNVSAYRCHACWVLYDDKPVAIFWETHNAMRLKVPAGHRTKTRNQQPKNVELFFRQWSYEGTEQLCDLEVQNVCVFVSIQHDNAAVSHLGRAARWLVVRTVASQQEGYCLKCWLLPLLQLPPTVAQKTHILGWLGMLTSSAVCVCGIACLSLCQLCKGLTSCPGSILAQVKKTKLSAY